MQAIVLARRDWREYDQLVTLLTREQGRVEVLARGVKKSVAKNAAYLEPFFLVEAEVVGGKELSHLTTVQPLESFDQLPANLIALELLSYSLKIVALLTPFGEKDERLFDLLLEWMRFLNTGPVHRGVVDAFLLQVLSAAGFTMVVDRCVVCDSEEKRAIYPAGGGVVCEQCALAKRQVGQTVLPLSPQTLQRLSVFSNSSFATADQPALPELHEAIMAFAIYHSHQSLPNFSV